jgi:hypothetical protein
MHARAALFSAPRSAQCAAQTRARAAGCALPGSGPVGAHASQLPPWHAPRPCTPLLKPLTASNAPRLLLSLRPASPAACKRRTDPGERGTAVRRQQCTILASTDVGLCGNPCRGLARTIGVSRERPARAQRTHPGISAAARLSTAAFDAGCEGLCEARPQQQATRSSACDAGARTVQPRQHQMQPGNRVAALCRSTQVHNSPFRNPRCKARQLMQFCLWDTAALCEPSALQPEQFRGAADAFIVNVRAPAGRGLLRGGGTR